MSKIKAQKEADYLHALLLLMLDARNLREIEELKNEMDAAVVVITEMMQRAIGEEIAANVDIAAGIRASLAANA